MGRAWCEYVDKRVCLPDEGKTVLQHNRYTNIYFMQDDRLLIGFFFVLLLVASGPWFLFLLTFLRRRTSKKLATGLASGLTIMSLLLATLIGSLWLFLYHPQREFSPEYWDEHQAERYTMREDIIQSQRLIGLSPAQVRYLLGEPTTKYRPAETQLSYDIGYPPSLTTKDFPDLLVIEFRNGQVVNVR
jgi:4-amino-4-deoxy-L-arabinose transferase-like glycosyltransferase